MKSLLKAETDNSKFTVYLTGIQPKMDKDKKIEQDWELISVNHIKDWSNGLDMSESVQDTYCHIPGYGEASIHMEAVNGNT